MSIRDWFTKTKPMPVEVLRNNPTTGNVVDLGERRRRLAEEALKALGADEGITGGERLQILVVRYPDIVELTVPGRFSLQLSPEAAMNVSEDLATAVSWAPGAS